MASTDPTRLEILLSKEEEYYFRTTLYKFLAPITIFRLMQNHLTTFDLELEPYYKNHYSLAKCVYFSFADYDNISKAEPHINDSQVQTESSKEGVDRGKIDRLADLLLDDNDRVITFGKFEDKCLKPPIVKPFDDFALLFKEFNPHKRRVLWRILIIQAIL